jgi:arylformamidase
MTIHDISLTLSADLPVWPGDPKPVIRQVTFMDQGELANVSRLEIGVHTGTHVDAPHHFLNDGRLVADLDLEVLTGPAWVLRVPDEVAEIGADHLERSGLPAGVERLLLRTRNSAWWADPSHAFREDFAALRQDGARWLVHRGVRLVGVDYLSVAPFREPAPTHRVLLEAGLVIVEGLDLSRVEPGAYRLYCLPLKLAGAEGAPARAILVDD